MGLLSFAHPQYFYFWLLLQKKSDALDQNRYSHSAIIAPGKSYCI